MSVEKNIYDEPATLTAGKQDGQDKNLLPFLKKGRRVTCFSVSSLRGVDHKLRKNPI
jgi:hypothetical protein